ncbi:hypothetical protein U91I_01419 [alpha proteobacterium U9-1i]|nr:hypothetical protein U91I_01419 [alpha proteobacterium U9-1i]
MSRTQFRNAPLTRSGPKMANEPMQWLTQENPKWIVSPRAGYAAPQLERV